MEQPDLKDLDWRVRTLEDWRKGVDSLNLPVMVERMTTAIQDLKDVKDAMRQMTWGFFGGGVLFVLGVAANILIPH